MSEETGNQPLQWSRPDRGRSHDGARSGVVNQKNNGNHDEAEAARPRLFAGVLPADYARITAAGRVKEFARGETLYLAGEPVKQVLLLTSGLAKINQVGLSGMEVILGLGIPGDVLGAEGLFSTGTHCTSAQAFRLCRVLVWDAPTFKSLVEHFPVLFQNMARILGEHLSELEQRFREVATEKVGSRVANQLVRLLERIGRKVDGQVEIGLSQEDLALMTGTTLFTVSRLFSAWEARGMVRPSRRTVTICDVQSLRAVSEDGLPRALAHSATASGD